MPLAKQSHHQSSFYSKSLFSRQHEGRLPHCGCRDLVWEGPELRFPFSAWFLASLRPCKMKPCGITWGVLPSCCRNYPGMAEGGKKLCGGCPVGRWGAGALLEDRLFFFFFFFFFCLFRAELSRIWRVPGLGSSRALGQAWVLIGLPTCQSPGFSGPQQTQL